MIVTCPACATRFMIDPRALGAGGRSVRCSQCNHVWVQDPPEDGPRRVDLQPRGAERPAPARAAIAMPAAAPARNVPLPPLPPAAETPRPSAPPPEYTAATDNTIVRGSNRPLIVAAILVLIIGVLWYGRDFIVDRVPALQGVYALFGDAGPGTLGDDLEIRRITSNRRDENGHATLVIDGEVANVSSGSRHVPPVRITLEDATRRPIKSWTVVATTDPLPPGETAPFHSSVADPGVAALGAAVSFDVQ